MYCNMIYQIVRKYITKYDVNCVDLTITHNKVKYLPDILNSINDALYKTYI
jgi:hypothetical protein